MKIQSSYLVKGCINTWYQKFPKSWCSGKDELQYQTGLTFEQCKSFCSNEMSCVSFEWNRGYREPFGEGCFASTSCLTNETTHDNGQDLFIKRCNNGMRRLYCFLKM